MDDLGKPRKIFPLRPESKESTKIRQFSDKQDPVTLAIVHDNLRHDTVNKLLN